MLAHRTCFGLVLLAACAAGACMRPAVSTPSPGLVGHAVRLDDEGRLLSWSRAPSPYAHVAGLAWNALETLFPVQDNGVETYLAWSRFDPQRHDGVSWPHNPAGLYAMLTDSAVLWYEFSGDVRAVALARKALDYQLAHGTTPGHWDWARVPYASAGAGDVDYRGADDQWCDFCGRGDGIGVIEPDKVAELGYAYVQLFELTREGRYRGAAIACADALATHVRDDADDRHSPWPFRVYAETDVVREEYSANVVGALMLFDELVRLSLGDVEEYRRARAIAFDWLMRVPVGNDAWSGYFEDIAIQNDPATNPNQYVALRTARWLLTHPQEDPRWREHAAHLIAWAIRTFGADTATELGTQWSATVMSEQAADMAKMGSHTARLGATMALWYAMTGDAPAREQAARSLDWATYTCNDEGIVAVGESTNEGWWFSDGYGDYIRHFLVAMAEVPDWAPPRENHLLASTSIVSHVSYSPKHIAWTTFDADATETLRLVARPSSVLASGETLFEHADLAQAGYTVRPLSSGGVVVRVRHTKPGDVVITTAATAAEAPDAGAPAAERLEGPRAGRMIDRATAGQGLSKTALVLRPHFGCAVGRGRRPGDGIVALGALAALVAMRARTRRRP